MSWPPRDENGWLIPHAPVTPESVEQGFSVLGNGIGCILSIIQIFFFISLVISLPIYAVIYAGEGSIIPVIIAPLLLIIVAFLFAKAVKLQRAIVTGSMFVTLLVVFITTILVVYSYIGYSTQTRFSQVAPTVVTVPSGTVSENISLACNDPYCIVGVQLDHIDLASDQQSMTLTFIVTSSQDCAHMYFDKVSLQDSTTSASFNGQSQSGSEWDASSGQATTVDVLFDLYPTAGNSYQLLVEITGDCYNAGDADHFQPQTIAF